MLVLQATWTRQSLSLWAESLESWRSAQQTLPAPAFGNGEAAGATAVADAVTTDRLQSAADADEVIEALQTLLGPNDAPQLLADHRVDTLAVAWPRDTVGPWPSDRLASAAGAMEPGDGSWLGRFELPAVSIDPRRVLPLLISLESAEPPAGIDYGHSLRYWQAVGRYVIELLSQQRFIPTLIRTAEVGLTARWQPWLHDESARERVGNMLEAMPPVVRATDDDHAGRPWSILHDALQTMVDQTVRQALIADDFAEALEDRDATEDPHVALLSGLLGTDEAIDLPADRTTDLLRDLGAWVGRLDESGQELPLRLCLRLSEPVDSHLLAELQPPGDDTTWPLTFHLRGVDDPEFVLDAEQVWGIENGAASTSGLPVGRPEELLLTELGRAARIYPQLDSALTGTAPTGIDLTTNQAFEFLAEYRSVLVESGFVVEIPEWWDDPASQLGARIHVNAPELAPRPASGAGQSSSPGLLGLKSLVDFKWQLAVGDQPLTAEEFQRLTAGTAPLLRVRGRWVRLQRDQVDAARAFLAQHPGGETTLLQAIQLAHGVHGAPPGLPILGMDAEGWVGDLLDAAGDRQRMKMVDQPGTLLGELRPYQKTGLSWLAFLDELGLGACLADDMGLGKTVQLIALLLHERLIDPKPGPTLLLVPTSLIVNWARELARFASDLTIHIQHGPDRPTGTDFVEIVQDRDVVITTYGLVSRDQETLGRIEWRRVVLDEAQYIKNPPTKQTGAIRALNTQRRVALTGTPVENRLSELWSIMDFCNPGYLGTPADFRRRFAVPIERHRDRDRVGVLRRLIQPFVLRRLKTDPLVIDDLPPCVQTREYANLTAEQAELYEQVVSSMLTQVDSSEGIQRRGLVLSTLVKLKQVCNHPALLADPSGDKRAVHDGMALASRSGKTRRLLEMLEEILATGDRVLIFTQFRKMGHLLTTMIQHDFDTEALFLHGGTPQKRRQQMIDRFQDPKSNTPVFVLSLKAGGIGLNLTAATHVFHFDRWWNPAVENQATDRAFRIGQTRTVHVHKFVCMGTLEERIDQMIEQKTELAKNIIGSGEHWLTEMSTIQLRDVLTLRQTALEELDR